MVIHAQPQYQEQQNAEEQNFMETALRARERTYELRDFVAEEIGSIPDEVEDLLDEADALLAENTTQKTIEAMNQYKNAYQHLHRYLIQNGVDTETPEKARGLLIAINRTYLRIEKLDDTMHAINSSLDEADPYYEEVASYLEWGWGNLTEAADDLNLANQSLYLEPPSITWAAHNLTEANTNIQETHVALKLIACWTNRWRVRKFLGELDRIRERIRGRIRQGGFNLTAILEKLGYSSLEDFEQVIEGLMEDAQQRMEIQEAVQELWTIREKLIELDLELQKRGQGS